MCGGPCILTIGESNFSVMGVLWLKKQKRKAWPLIFREWILLSQMGWLEEWKRVGLSQAKEEEILSEKGKQG